MRLILASLLASVLSMAGAALCSPAVAAAPSPPSQPDSTHPVVMQQEAARVASAGVVTKRPFASALPRASAAAASGTSREVFGFALASSLSDPTVGDPSWDFSLLSTVAFFGLHVQNDGSLASDSGMAVWNSSDLTNLLNLAHSHGTRVVVTIIEQDFNPGTPNMCATLAHAATTVSAIAAQVQSKGVDGVNVDYEGLNGSCGTGDPSWARHSLTAFVASLRSALAAGSYLSIDTYASSATDALGFFDVAGLSASVDSFFVMAYDLEYSNWSRAPLGCSSFCLGPTAPLTGYYYNDTSTASHYTSVIPASKVILGVPYYGRKSCVTAAAPNQYPIAAVEADTYLSASTESSSNLVQQGSYATHRDANDAPGNERWDTWFNTSLSCTRELYWDDTVSLGNKYALVNSDNLRGVGMWNLNYGGGAPELWALLATYFASVKSTAYVSFGPQALGSASAAQTVTLTNGSGAAINVSAVNLGGANPGDFAKGSDTCTGQSIAAAGTCTVQFTFTPSDSGVRNAIATFVNSGPENPTTALVGIGGSSEASTRLYFTWYDFASAGVNAEAIHITNPTGAVATGTISLHTTTAIAFSVPPGQDVYYSFPHGTIGGPVVIDSTTVPVLASLRAWYYQTFNETPARPALDAATALFFPWYDLKSPGVQAETIHITDPGGSGATGTISLPGATPLSFSVATGQDGYFTFPAGTMGGPVSITSSQPVLASLRAWYYQSFNETLARPASAAATTQYFPWYDLSSAGMRADTIHIANIGAAAATGSIELPDLTPLSFNVAPGRDSYFEFPQGTLGGPVTVSSSRPVLASLRAWYYQSFNEVPGRAASPGAAAQYFPWYDLASPGMRADTIHITNPSSSVVTGTISKPFASPISFTVEAGKDAYYSFPGQSIGGPVTIAANAPVLASLRAWYYQSFNEVPGSF